GRQLRLRRAVLVAGNDQIVVDLVADEGACGSQVKEPLREISADFTALVGDIGERARGQQAGGGKKTERMAAMDQESTGMLKKAAAIADGILVKKWQAAISSPDDERRRK